MESKTVLSLDLSTTCTGWSVFDHSSHKLLTYGYLRPSTKGLAKLLYPRQQLTKMIDLSMQILQLIGQYKPSYIVIEEIAGSKQRLGQKVLDGLHWVLLMHIQNMIDIVTYYDVTGLDGWRTHLNLRLSEQDKIHNKEAKKLNKQMGREALPIYDAKDLAARYVNSTHGLNLDVQMNRFDADVADSIAMGSAFLRFKCPRN